MLKTKTVRLIWALLPAALLAPPVPARAQTPLNEKSRYEAELENKINQAILNVLGPNKARVVVQAQMDFSSTEKVEIAGGAQEQQDFRWAGIAAEKTRRSGPSLLPGFPVPYSPGAAQLETKSYARQLSYPSSLVKKLSVSVIINKSLPAEEAAAIRAFVSDVMGLDADRGDQITVVRASFVSFWKTVWFTPEALNVIFRYGIISLAVIIAMLAVMVALLKLSSSMRSMAPAQQISMDFKASGGEPAEPGAEAEGLPALPKEAGKGPGPEGEPDSGEEEGETYFKVKAHQVPTLVHMMAKENPANVALISAHLAPEIRAAFMRGLPPQLASEVMASMAEVRFVKPEMIAAIQEELERRFSGAVGGIEKVFEVMDAASPGAKRAMLLELERRHPEVARKVRRRVLLLEDLELLDERELGLLVSAVRVQEWAGALTIAGEALKARVKAQLNDNAKQVLEQTVKFGFVSREKAEENCNEVLAAATRLIKDGRIRHPMAGGAGGGEMARA